MRFPVAFLGIIHYRRQTKLALLTLDKSRFAAAFVKYKHDVYPGALVGAANYHIIVFQTCDAQRVGAAFVVDRLTVIMLTK